MARVGAGGLAIASGTTAVALGAGAPAAVSERDEVAVFGTAWPARGRVGAAFAGFPAAGTGPVTAFGSGLLSSAIVADGVGASCLRSGDAAASAGGTSSALGHSCRFSKVDR